VGSEEDEERRVSKRPGAEGAPWFVGSVVLVGCEAGGATRRDCVREGRLVSMVGRVGLREERWGKVAAYHFDGSGGRRAKGEGGCQFKSEGNRRLQGQWLLLK
jgi:hypothetical protein